MILHEDEHEATQQLCGDELAVPMLPPIVIS